MKTHRRDFLKNTARLTTQAWILSHLPVLPAIRSLHAGARIQDRFFVLLVMEGGWDVTLGLDPWYRAPLPDPQDLFIEYRPEDVFKKGNIALGPAADPLQAHADDLTIINGILLSEADNGHPAALSYMSRGSTLANAPDLALALADRVGPLPYGVISANRNLQRGDSRVLVSSAEDILASMSTEDATRYLPDLQSSHTPLESAIQLILGTTDTRARLIQELKALSAHLEGGLTPTHVAAASFLSGASAQAEILLNVNAMDTHSDHPGNHLRIQREGWDQVAQVFSTFKNIPFGTGGRSLFDHTTFMVISEFARTPTLNASKGKDHNPLLNSVLLAGAGIPKGRTIGASRLITRAQNGTRSSIHMASPFDFTTGHPITAPSDRASFLFPEDVAKKVSDTFSDTRRGTDFAFQRRE